MTTPTSEAQRAAFEEARVKQAAKERAAAEETERQAAINDERFAAMGPGMGFRLCGGPATRKPHR